MEFNLPKFDFSALTESIKPPVLNLPDPKTLKITSAIDNIQNVNRLRDMDNLYFQIEMKNKQKEICKKRLKSIISTLDIKIGIFISLAIIILSVIIPFFIVAFQDYLQQYQIWIYIYLIVTFSISMVAMSIYLLLLCLKK